MFKRRKKNYKNKKGKQSNLDVRRNCSYIHDYKENFLQNKNPLSQKCHRIVILLAFGLSITYMLVRLPLMVIWMACNEDILVKKQTFFIINKCKLLSSYLNQNSTRENIHSHKIVNNNKVSDNWSRTWRKSRINHNPVWLHVSIKALWIDVWK